MKFTWHDIEQRTPEWFALRLGIPTASNFHKILTPKTLKLSESRNKYRNQLLAEWMTGTPHQDDYLSKSMEAGIDNEDRARAAYEMIVDAETTRPGFFTAYDGMAGASPDALLEPSTDLEIKCRELHTQIGWALMTDDSERQDHRIQCQGRLLIEQREWSHLWNFNQQMAIPVLKSPRDERVISAIDQALRQFIDELLAARERLTREYGPFPRFTEVPAEDADHSKDFISDEDVEAILAGQREQHA